jgi:hypothetical protein
MLRFYLDSNIFRATKPSSRNYTPILHNLLKDLKDKVLFVYSLAHLNDLRSSDKTNRDIDLQQMEEFVGDNYFTRDPIKNKFHCQLVNPITAYYAYDFENDSKVTNPFDLDSLFDDMEDPAAPMLKAVLNKLFDVPIRSFGGDHDPAQWNDVQRKMLEKMIPGYHPDMTIGSLMKNMGPFVAAMIQSPKEVNELRTYMATYIDREEYSFEKWGMDFDQKFGQTAIGKTFTDLIDQMIPEHQKDDFYLRFKYTYTLLEMYNVTQEKVGGRKKKFSYTSLTTDSDHAYYGSACDYLVTDDKGLQIKAAIVYRLLGIGCQVLSSKDLLNLKTILLSQEETIDSLATSLGHDLKHALVLAQEQYQEPYTITTTYKTSHPYFNYFNRLQIKQDTTPKYILFNYRKSHEQTLMYREVELVTNKIVRLLKEDDYKRKEFDFDTEFKNDGMIRTWTLNSIVYNLGRGYYKGIPIVYLEIYINKKLIR